MSGLGLRGIGVQGLEVEGIGGKSAKLEFWDFEPTRRVQPSCTKYTNNNFATDNKQHPQQYQYYSFFKKYRCTSLGSGIPHSKL